MQACGRQIKTVKVCGNCGEAIPDKDGENFCRSCEERRGDPVAMRLRRGMRNDRGAARLSAGLVMVLDDFGGTHWR